ncbi:hypothetical protein Pelo_1403 [Pelomyxa schiedti]|nr:hypothetical protein Pelo_1403 [Pelomyxa schiedti]
MAQVPETGASAAFSSGGYHHHNSGGVVGVGGWVGVDGNCGTTPPSSTTTTSSYDVAVGRVEAVVETLRQVTDILADPNYDPAMSQSTLYDKIQDYVKKLQNVYNASVELNPDPLIPLSFIEKIKKGPDGVPRVARMIDVVGYLDHGINPDNFTVKVFDKITKENCTTKGKVTAVQHFEEYLLQSVKPSLPTDVSSQYPFNIPPVLPPTPIPRPITPQLQQQQPQAPSTAPLHQQTPQPQQQLQQEQQLTTTQPQTTPIPTTTKKKSHKKRPPVVVVPLPQQQQQSPTPTSTQQQPVVRVQVHAMRHQHPPPSNTL